MKKRGFWELGVYLAIFLVVSIPFYTADVFAEEENVRVNSFGSEVFEIGKFGKVTPLSLDSDNFGNDDSHMLNVLPFVLTGVIAGSLVLFSSSAVVVLALLIMIPIVSKRAEASRIGSFKVKGDSTEIEGFANDVESLIFKAEDMSIDGDDDITPDQLKLFEGLNIIPTTFKCREDHVNDVFDCDSNPVANSYCNSQIFALELYDDNDNYVTGKSSNTLICDVKEPVIINISSDKSSYISTDTVIISYSFTDSACNGPGCFGKCSGFDRIRFTGGYSDVIDLLPGTANTCSYSGSTSILAADFTPVNDNVTIMATVYDNVNNKKSENISFIVDLTKPVITDFNMPKYIENGVTTSLDITVDVADVSNVVVQANFSELGGSTSWVNGNCIGNMNKTCYWLEDVRLTEDTSGRVYFKATDIGGLEETADFPFSLTVYEGNGDVTINGIRCITQNDIDCSVSATTEDELIFTLNMSSAVPFSANGAGVIGNFSDINSGLGSEPADSCVKDGGYWHCDWIVDVTSPGLATIAFSATNLADYTETNSTEFDVYGVSEGDVGYWEVSSVDCLPSMIDRQVTTLTNQRVYCKVELGENYVSGVTSLKTASISLKECDGDTDYIVGGNPEILNALPESTEPYLFFELETTDFEVNELEFECQLAVTTIVDGETVTAVPEIENVSVKIEFYNLPLGELEESVQDKIDEIKNDSLVKFELESHITGFIDFGTKICGILNTWHSITGVVASAGLFLAAFPGAQSAAITLIETSDKMKDKGETLMAVFYNTCKYISCDVNIWGGWYNGYKLDFKLDEVIKQDSSIKLVDETWAKKLGYLEGGAFWPSSPKDSFFLSLATGCLPGIVNGIHKWRQIRCGYAICLRDSGINNIPIKACEDSKNYLICKAVAGEVFQLIPYADFFKRMFSQFTSVVSDPFGAVFGIWNFACEMAGGSSKAICVIGIIIPQIAGITYDLIEGVTQISEMEDFFMSAPDVCEELIGDGEGIL